MANQTTYDVFLSHNSADKAAVEELARRLVEAGLTPWLDTWNLVPGEPWQEAIEEALDACQTVAVFLGPSGIGSWENEEMRSALEERVRDKSRRVIPVLLPSAPDPREKPLPRFLRRLTWVDFRGGLDDEDAFQRLVAGIRGVAPGNGSIQVRSFVFDFESIDRLDWKDALRGLIATPPADHFGASGTLLGREGNEWTVAHLEKFLEPLSDQSALKGSIWLRGILKSTGEMFDELRVRVDWVDHEFIIEIGDNTKPERKSGLAARVCGVSRLKGVQLRCLLDERGKKIQSFDRGISASQKPDSNLAYERSSLEQQLTQHRRNLYKLRQQAATYAVGETPLHLLNQIEAEETEIRRIEVQLRALKD
jgi:hypothetical protein